MRPRWGLDLSRVEPRPEAEAAVETRGRRPPLPRRVEPKRPERGWLKGAGGILRTPSALLCGACLRWGSGSLGPRPVLVFGFLGAVGISRSEMVEQLRRALRV